MNNKNFKTELSVSLTNKKELYKSYMPFLAHGGIFIVSNDSFEINDKLILNIQISSDEDYYKLSTEVVWKSTNKNIGIGLAFLQSEVAITVKKRIENILGNDFLYSNIPTYTM